MVKPCGGLNYRRGRTRVYIFSSPSPPHPTFENNFSPHKLYMLARVFTKNWGKWKIFRRPSMKKENRCLQIWICLGKKLSTTLSKARKDNFWQCLTIFVTVLQLVWQYVPKFDKIGQNWAKLDKIGQNWTKLDKIGQNWTKLNEVE